MNLWSKQKKQKSGLRGRISLQFVVAVDQVMRFWYEVTISGSRSFRFWLLRLRMASVTSLRISPPFKKGGLLQRSEYGLCEGGIIVSWKTCRPKYSVLGT